MSVQRTLILDAAGEGIVGTDADGVVTFMNPAGKRMTGYVPGELTGHGLHATLHHTKADGSPYPVEECPMHASLLDGAIHHCDEDVYWRKDGTSLPGRVHEHADRRRTGASAAPSSSSTTSPSGAASSASRTSSRRSSATSCARR